MVFAGMRSRPPRAPVALAVLVFGCAAGGRTALLTERPGSSGVEPVTRPPAEPGPSFQNTIPKRMELEVFAEPSAAAPAEAPPREARAARPDVEIEPVYVPGRRPAPSGEVARAGDDELVARWNAGGNGDPSYPPNRSSFHPGARVVVDTRVIYPRLPSSGPSARGLTHGRLLAQARSRGYWPFRLCYEGGLRQNPTLSGETRIRFTLGPRGGVLATRLLATELKDRSVAACLSRRARSLRFDPAPGRKVDVDLSVKLWPGDAPLPPLSADAPELDPATARGIERSLRTRQEHVERCYAAGLARDPALWGRIALTFVVDRTGAITKLEERESRFPDKSVVDCLARALAELELPDGARETTFVAALRLGTLPSDPVPAQPSATPVGAERSADAPPSE
jgi:hypothetical protein